MRPIHLTGDWGLLATLHRPTDAPGIAAAAHQLAGMGLKPRDIAITLSLTESAVSTLLRDAAAPSLPPIRSTSHVS